MFIVFPSHLHIVHPPTTRVFSEGENMYAKDVYLYQVAGF